VNSSPKVAVIPAKAGIQALNGSRALRAISKPNCGSPHRRRVSFFARAKKETKESTPRMARKPHCASRRNRRSPNSPGAKYAPRAQTRGSLLPIPTAMLGRAIREVKTSLGFAMLNPARYKR